MEMIAARVLRVYFEREISATLDELYGDTKKYFLKSMLLRCERYFPWKFNSKAKNVEFIWYESTLKPIYNCNGDFHTVITIISH